MAKRIYIKLESENYRCFLKFQIKEDCESKEKIDEMVNDLNNFFDFKVTQIYHLLPDGRPFNYYAISNCNNLPSDKDLMSTYAFNVNADFCDRLYIINKDQHTQCKGEEMQKLFSKYFYSFNKGEKIISVKFFKSMGVNFKSRKNKTFSGYHGLPHSNAYDSDIEKILGEELKKSNIDFITQQPIHSTTFPFSDSITLTIADFFIEKCKLVIYCDGFQYHYNKESVIKDRSQDRILQYLGYRVLRYTGSEIVGNIGKCVTEIKDFIQKFTPRT